MRKSAVSVKEVENHQELFRDDFLGRRQQRKWSRDLQVVKEFAERGINANKTIQQIDLVVQQAKASGIELEMLLNMVRKQYEI